MFKFLKIFRSLLFRLLDWFCNIQKFKNIHLLEIILWKVVRVTNCVGTRTPWTPWTQSTLTLFIYFAADKFPLAIFNEVSSRRFYQRNQKASRRQIWRNS